MHTDLCGPLSQESIGGGRYFLTFTDDKSRFVTTYILKNKSECFTYFKEYIKFAERWIGKQLKTLRSDNGGEFTSNEFQQFCKNEGIGRQLTVVYTPQQNGVAERLNLTLQEMVSSLLHDTDLPLPYWAEALMTSTFLRNRLPTTVVACQTPYEAFTGKKPSIQHLRTFGCLAYAFIPKQKRTKLSDKARKLLIARTRSH